MFLTLVYNLDMLLNSVVQFSSVYQSVYMDRTFVSLGSLCSDNPTIYIHYLGGNTIS